MYKVRLRCGFSSCWQYYCTIYTILSGTSLTLLVLCPHVPTVQVTTLNNLAPTGGIFNANEQYLVTPLGVTNLTMTITSKDPANRLQALGWNPAYTIIEGQQTQTKAQGLGWKCYSEGV